MDTLKKRFLLFLIGCIGTRLLLVYVAKNIGVQFLKYMGFLTLPIALGFFYIFATGSRQTGAEVFGDKIWWNYLRSVHGFLYLLFPCIIIGNNNAWKFLLVDIIIGFTSFIIFHYKSGNLKKLF